MHRKLPSLGASDSSFCMTWCNVRCVSSYAKSSERDKTIDLFSLPSVKHNGGEQTSSSSVWRGL